MKASLSGDTEFSALRLRRRRGSGKMPAEEAERMELKTTVPQPAPKAPTPWTGSGEDDLRQALHFALLASRAPRTPLWARCWIPSRRRHAP
jgi:hypothetical protein